MSKLENHRVQGGRKEADEKVTHSQTSHLPSSILVGLCRIDTSPHDRWPQEAVKKRKELETERHASCHVGGHALCHFLFLVQVPRHLIPFRAPLSAIGVGLRFGALNIAP